MDIVFHMLIPAMLAIVAGLGVRKALLLAPVAVIPDLDAAFSAHRLYFHTIFIPIAIGIFSVVSARSQGRKPYGQILLFASLFYFSHLFLDAFGGPVGLLWPLNDIGYGISISIDVTQRGIVPLATSSFHFIAQKITIPNSISNVAAASPQSVGVAVLFLLALIASEKRSLNLMKKEGKHTKPL